MKTIHLLSSVRDGGTYSLSEALSLSKRNWAEQSPEWEATGCAGATIVNVSWDDLRLVLSLSTGAHLSFICTAGIVQWLISDSCSNRLQSNDKSLFLDFGDGIGAEYDRQEIARAMCGSQLYRVFDTGMMHVIYHSRGPLIGVTCPQLRNESGYFLYWDFTD